MTNGSLAVADSYETQWFRSGRCSLHLRGLPGHARQPTYILINGVPVTSIVYDSLARNLNRGLGAPVQIVDLPGTGKSRNSSYTWTASERCLHAYLKSLEEEFVLVVHDIAGPIALPLLAEESLNLRGAVVLNTILRPTKFRPIFPLSLIRTPVIGAIVSPLTPKFYFDSEIRKKGVGRNSQLSNAELDRIYREFSANFGKSRLHRVMRGFELNQRRENKIDRGLRSSIPKLTVWGLADPSLGGQASFIPRIAHSHVVRLPDAKHFLMLDYADEIYEAIRARRF